MIWRHPARWRAPSRRRVARWLLPIVAALWAHPGLAAEDCPRALTQYHLRVWTHEHGLPLDTVYSLAQTPDGFLWVGTEDGLARFDGVEFETVEPAERALAEPNVIESLAVASAGALYAGTGSSGVWTLREGALVPVPGGTAPHHPVDALLPGDGDRVWIATRGAGLLVSKDHHLEHHGEAEGLADPVVTDLAFHHSGELWLGLGGGGVQRFDGERFHDPVGAAALDGIVAETVLEDRKGRLWIGSRDGLYRLEDGELRRYGAEDGLGVPYVKDLMEDARGRLWVGTGGGGVARLCGDRFERLGEDGGLPLGQVEQVFEDAEGHIWLATGGGGLVQLSPGAATPLTAAEGLPPYPVLPILQARDGAMWIGTFGGGLVRRKDGRTEIFGVDQGLSSERILSLAEDPDGSLWVGTRAGLDRLRRDGVERLTEEDGLPHATVGSLLHDGERLWVGTVGGVASVEDGAVSTFQPPGGSFGGHISALRSGADGTLWIGTDGGGLYRLRNGAIAPVPLGPDAPSRVVFAIHQQDDGALWIATGSGVVRYAEGRATRITEEHGLPNDQVFSFLEDGLGGLWMSSNSGVFRVDFEALQRLARGEADHVTARLFDESDGMPRAETNGGFQPAAWRDRQGHLWYPTSEGIALFDPSALAEPPDPPRPVLRSLWVDGTRSPTTADVVVPPNPGWIRISYTAPTFADPEGLQFQYRLQGFEDEWFGAGSAREALYRQLPPGRFVFEVRVRRPVGPWSAPRAIAVVVERHFYETPWFWLGAALITGLLGALALRHRARVRRRRRERLQQAQKLEAIGLLAGGVAHDFNNVLTAILGYNDLLSMKLSDDPAVREELSEVRRAAERGAGLSRQLLAFGRQDRSNPRWLDVAEEIRRLESFLRRLIPETIRIELDLDPDAGRCYIDALQLEQIVLNLALNARDAMPRGGTLTLELTPVVDPEALREIDAESADRYARLSVRDTGTGMDEATQRRVFEPFFTTKGPGEGSGMGLAVTYGIVRQSGGTIEIDSAVGKGTTFHVVLPAASASDREADGEDPASPTG